MATAVKAAFIPGCSHIEKHLFIHQDTDASQDDSRNLQVTYDKENSLFKPNAFLRRNAYRFPFLNFGLSGWNFISYARR